MTFQACKVTFFHTYDCANLITNVISERTKMVLNVIEIVGRDTEEIHNTVSECVKNGYWHAGVFFSPRFIVGAKPQLPPYEKQM